MLLRLARPYRARTALAVVNARRVHGRRPAPAVSVQARCRRRHRGRRSPHALSSSSPPSWPQASRPSSSRVRRPTSPAGSASGRSPTSASSSSATCNACRSATTSATGPARSSAGSRTTSRRSTSSSRTASRASSRTRSSSSEPSSCCSCSTGASPSRRSSSCRSWPSRRAGSARARTARTSACESDSASSRRPSPRTSPACASCSRSRESRRARPTFRGVNERYRESNYETVILNGIYFPAVDILSSVATAIVLGLGGWLVVEGNMTIGTLLAFTLYLGNFFDPVQQLSQLYNTFLSATAALDRITTVLDEEPDIVDAPTARELGRIDGHVRFDHVRFGYGDLPDVLHDFDLDVPPERPSRSSATRAPGSRRSRSCLLASTTRATAALTIDGTDLRDVTQASLRRQLGIVPQEGFLFAGSIADNIAFGRPSATRVGDRGRRGGRRRRRLHRGAAGELRHRGRGARLQAVARPAAAHRVRARAPRRSAHPHPRRGDVVRRHRHGAEDRPRPAPPPDRPNRVHHRPPPLDDPACGPDRRARPRTHRRRRHARRADRAARPIHAPVRRLGRRGRVARPGTSF